MRYKNYLLVISWVIIAQPFIVLNAETLFSGESVSSIEDVVADASLDPRMADHDVNVLGINRFLAGLPEQATLHNAKAEKSFLRNSRVDRLMVPQQRAWVPQFAVPLCNAIFGELESEPKSARVSSDELSTAQEDESKLLIETDDGEFAASLFKDGKSLLALYFEKMDLRASQMIDEEGINKVQIAVEGETKTLSLDEIGEFQNGKIKVLVLTNRAQTSIEGLEGEPFVLELEAWTTSD